MSETASAVDQAEVNGGVIVPAGVGICYALYLLIAVDRQSMNGWLLLSLAVLSIGSTFVAPKFTAASFIPSVFGWYVFGVLGCLGLGLALAEGGGWPAIGSALIALFFGWYALARALRFRRHRSQAA